MPLFFRIQPSLPEPAYRQIVDGVRSALGRKELQPGERLPSIRSLARTLAINPNTVARAYRELEHLGLVTSQRGSGFEVRGGPTGEETARKKFQDAVREATEALGPKETLELVRKIVQEEERRKESENDTQ